MTVEGQVSSVPVITGISPVWHSALLCHVSHGTHVAEHKFLFLCGICGMSCCGLTLRGAPRLPVVISQCLRFSIVRGSESGERRIFGTPLDSE